MADNVSIQINMENGELLVQAPAEALETVFAKLDSILPKLADLHKKFVSESVEPIQAEDTSVTEAQNLQGAIDLHNESLKRPSKRKRTAASKKPESFKMVDLGLDEKQRTQFKAFYGQKNPQGQNEQLLVIMAGLKNFGGKEYLTKDEIYTGLKTVNAKVPARISSVLSNLRIEGRIISEAEGYRIHHTGEDFVKFDLPKQDGNN